MINTSTVLVKKQNLLPIADYRSRVVILDLSAGEKARILQQYYPNKSNNFWKIMFQVFRESYHAEYKLKKQLLLRNGIALWNVMEQSEEGERPNDFQTFFQMHGTVNKIIFNGNTAAEHYNTHMGQFPGIPKVILPSTSSLNTWKSFEEKVMAWSLELKK